MTQMPHGQSIVSMTVFENRLFVASTSRLWRLDGDVLTPVDIVPDAAPAETEILADKMEGA